MEKIFGKELYIDVDELIKICRADYGIEKNENVKKPKVNKKSKNDEDSENDEDTEIVLELNVFKFEVFKSCIDRVLSENDEIDDDIAAFAQASTTTSFKIAYNTLIKHNILIENNND